MLKQVVLGTAALLVSAGVAQAQTCAAYPNTLTNGTTADATQVMADFNGIMTCANSNLAPLVNPHFTGSVGIGTTTPTYNLYVNGSAGGTSAWTNASDARLKMHVAPIDDALGIVGRLRGVRFEWRPAAQREVGTGLDLPVGEPQVGFIAQEVAAVVPEAVVGPKKGLSDIYGVKEESLIPILVEAVKEQQAEIVALKAEVATLRATK